MGIPETHVFTIYQHGLCDRESCLQNSRSQETSTFLGMNDLGSEMKVEGFGLEGSRDLGLGNK